MKNEENQKYGIIAILGEVNVGKSTLLNTLLNREISAVTHKANTTREKVRGIASDGNTQIVLVDTPGLSSRTIKKDRSLLTHAWGAIIEADFFLLVVDCTKPISQTLLHLFNELNAASKKLPDAILVINKIDKFSKEKLLLKSKEVNDYFSFKKTFMISALRGYGVNDLRSWIYGTIPKSSWVYPKSKKHDMTIEKFLNEKTREIILLRIHQEVPYNLEVYTDEIEELRDGKLKVWQSIEVHNARHRAMLIGKSGQTIKSISSNARSKMEKALNKKIHLFLEVKLKKKKSIHIELAEGSF